MLVGGQAKAQSELRIVGERRIGPGWTGALGAAAPWRNRKIAAVDRGAAGGIRDHHAVAEELREKLQVRRLAAAGAGARECEQRFQELHAAHGGEVDSRPIVVRQTFEERNVGALALEHRGFTLEIDRLHSRIDGAEGRAGLDAQTAAGAVLHIELKTEAHIRITACVDRRRFETLRRAGQPGCVVILRPDDAVRTDETALAALNAQLWPPHRHFVGDIALFPGRGAGREGPVHRHQAHRNFIPEALENSGRHLAHELRSARRHGRRAVERAGGTIGDFDLVQSRKALIDGPEVLLQDFLALGAVGLSDRILDLAYRLVARQYARDREEACLQHGVRAAPEAGLPRDPAGIDHEELQFIRDDLLLDRARQPAPYLAGRIGAVEQEGGARGGELQDVEALQEVELVTGDEIRRVRITLPRTPMMSPRSSSLVIANCFSPTRSSRIQTWSRSSSASMCAKQLLPCWRYCMTRPATRTSGPSGASPPSIGAGLDASNSVSNQRAQQRPPGGVRSTL